MNTTLSSPIVAIQEDIDISAEILVDAALLNAKEDSIGAMRAIQGKIAFVEVSKSLMCMNCQHRFTQTSLDEKEEKAVLKCPTCSVSTLKEHLAKYITASVGISSDGDKPERFHCPMSVLQSFFSSLTTEGYSIKEEKVEKMREEVIIETLLLVKMIGFNINEAEKKLCSMMIVK